MKKKVKEVEKSNSELKEIHQRTKSNMEDIKKNYRKENRKKKQAIMKLKH